MAYANGVNVQPDWEQTDETAENYIQNKPTIPELVQPDWEQTDETQPDYIKNKPVAANQAASTAEDVAGLVTDLNALLVKLKAAGLMVADEPEPEGDPEGDPEGAPEE